MIALGYVPSAAGLLRPVTANLSKPPWLVWAVAGFGDKLATHREIYHLNQAPPSMCLWPVKQPATPGTTD